MREKLDQGLGLTDDQFESIVRALCEDLMCTAYLNWADVCRPGSDATRQVVCEIEDPAMRKEVLRLCIATVRADGHIAVTEVAMLEALAQAWNIPLDVSTLRRSNGAAHPRHTPTM